MRSIIYSVMCRPMWDIESLWEKRGSTDATSEPEWSDYERMLGVLAEFCLGWLTFSGSDR